MDDGRSGEIEARVPQQRVYADEAELISATDF
jgi:hypothetical protein